MKIVKYKSEYRNEFANLLYQLEEFFADMDSMKKSTVTDNYKTVYIDYTLERVKNDNGIIYLAIENEEVIGAIVCILISYSEIVATNYLFDKEGEITELVIDKKYRGQEIGTKLIKKAEEYFKKCNCDIIRISAFAENKRGLKFYEKKGYSIRNIDFIKKI